MPSFLYYKIDFDEFITLIKSKNEGFSLLFQ